ncbi:MAG: hypothetical protein MRZ79_22955 [Bacteroidia bacterium]|nr:hypothetical protein [Bacteroidia bacterium]
MFGEGFPFDLVLFTLTIFTIFGVNVSKAERQKMLEEKEKQELENEI